MATALRFTVDLFQAANPSAARAEHPVPRVAPPADLGQLLGDQYGIQPHDQDLAPITRQWQSAQVVLAIQSRVPSRHTLPRNT